jgi:hypothetical protein
VSDSATNAVSVRAGSIQGANLGVRCPGLALARDADGTMVGTLPDGWATATIRTIGAKKAPGGFRSEPAPGATEAIGIGPFSVSGPFRIVKKFNSPKAACEAWDAAREPR